jgi:hypothetical protein
MVVIVAMCLVGCSGGGGPDEGGGGRGGSGGGGSGGGGGGSALTDAQRISIFCEKTLLPHCSNWFTSTAQCTDIMSRTMSPLCEAKWEAETDCLAQTTASDWSCALGEPIIASTLCRDQFRLGSYCRIAIATPACYSAPCSFSTDCASGSSCNDKTRHCFSLSAQCGGLPCSFSTDCPSGFTCNNALEQCVKN